MTDVTDFIGAAVEDKPVKAMKAFAAAMQPKIDAALDTKYTEVAHSVFNSQVDADDEAEMNELDNIEPEQEFETKMEEPQDV